MPLIPILAPDTRVRIPAMGLEAVITGARVKKGVNPVAYDVEFTEAGGTKRTARFNAIAVEALDAAAEPSRVRDLGQMIAEAGG